MDELSRTSRSRHRSRSRSCRHSSHRSRSYSPRDSTIADDNTKKQPQFIPIPVPYYQPQPPTAAQQRTTTHTPTASSNNNTQPISYIMPQAKPQYIEENIQPTVRIFLFLF